MPAPEVATIDFETFKIDARPVYPPKPVGVAIKIADAPSRYYAWGHASDNNCDRAEAMAALHEVVNSGIPLLFHNAKFDTEVMTEHCGVSRARLPWDRIHDTLFLMFLAEPHARAHGLKEVAHRRLNMPPDEKNEIALWVWQNRKRIAEESGARVNSKRIGDLTVASNEMLFLPWVPGDLVGRYAIGDVDRTALLFKDLWAEVVDRDGMLSPYNRERQLLPILMENERQGIRVDIDRLARDTEAYAGHLVRVDEAIRRRLGAPGLNLDAKQDYANALVRSGVVLEKDMPRTDPTARHSEGQYSVSKEVLKPHLFTDQTVASAVGYRNRLKTCLTMFMEPWLSQASQRNGWISTNWNQTRGTDGGTRCMPAGELVYTSRGWLPVEDVVRGDTVLSHTGEPRRVLESICNGKKPLLKTTLDNGLMLRSTWNHEYLLSDGTWVRADALAAGAEVVVACDLEIWRKVSGYDYDVSDWGRVRNAVSHHVLKTQEKGRWGHRRVTLKRAGKKAGFAVHRLVAEAFQVPGVGPEIRHLNGVAWDNRPQNLRRGTAKENRADAKNHGTLWARHYGSRWPSLEALPPRPSFFHTARVVSVEEIAEDVTFGLTVEVDHSHVTAGVVTHNTGRPSTNNPNFLNISKEFENRPDGYEHPSFLGVPMLPFVRSYLLADPGGLWCHRDFSGQELRVFAHYESGPLLAEYIKNPALDPHSWVRDEMLRLAPHLIPKGLDENEHADRLKKLRGRVKIVNFQSLYGGGIQAIMDAMDVSREEAMRFRTFHDQALPGRKILDRLLTNLVKSGAKMRTLGGRLYDVEPPLFKNGRGYEFYYKLINYLIQGGAADLTKQAIIDWYNHPARSRDSRFLVTVYDEINISAPIGEHENQMELLRDVMCSPRIDCPMLSDGKIGPSWGQLEDCA